MPKYNIEMSEGSTYARAIELVQGYGPSFPEGGLYLDLACGYGVIAKHVQDELGLKYVGIDSDIKAVASIVEKGFEAHLFSLSESLELVEQGIYELAGSRKISVISILDGIEHLPNYRDVLNMISKIAKNQDCPVVLSIPNITHIDVGLKLAAGLWQYTETGLLDETHVRFFTQEQLRADLRSSGLEVIEKNDLRLNQSDQHFPTDHPYLAHNSSINKLLTFLRSNDTSATINQFVWLCVPRAGSQSHGSEVAGEVTQIRPVITIVLRTQGQRVSQFKEAILSVAAQDYTDYNVLIVGHNMEQSQVQQISEFLSALPFEFQTRLRFDLISGGSRATPLNYGLRNGTGEYITFLDDDDIALPNWLSVFSGLSLNGYGQVLRSHAVVQDFEISGEGMESSKATSGFGSPYSAEFSLFEHLIHNQSPFMTLAFPRTLHSYLGLEFDEKLSTTEDWDFLLRCAGLVGVKNSREVTVIYRKWKNLETSAAISQLEWNSNSEIILGVLAKQPILLPAGEVLQIPGVLNKYAEMLYRDRFESSYLERFESSYLERVQIESRLWQDAWQRAEKIRLSEITGAMGKAITVFYSRSWRWTSPARSLINTLRGRKSPSIFALDLQNAQMVNEFVEMIQNSIWWKITKPFRKKI
jgi:2-polyprenyl-3-methyl-5-hydroxy-6-metoxy-1,4-benzoquinol methylase